MLLALVTARASDSMFYPSTLCALQIAFMIMIMIQRTSSSGENWPLSTNKMSCLLMNNMLRGNVDTLNL